MPSCTLLKIKASKTGPTCVIWPNIGINFSCVIRTAFIAKKRDTGELFRSFFDATEVDYTVWLFWGFANPSFLKIYIKIHWSYYKAYCRLNNYQHVRILQGWSTHFRTRCNYEPNETFFAISGWIKLMMIIYKINMYSKQFIQTSCFSFADHFFE